MTGVEAIALWIGLVSSIAGIVLSIVATVFAVYVNNRASEINDRTIQSLQKIESAVDRSSEDTRELIRAGWNKMLGNVGKPSNTESDSASAREIASGLAAELRAELGLGGSNEPSPQTDEIERLNDLLENLEISMEAQLTDRDYLETPGEALDYSVAKLRNLAPRPQALVQAIVSLHLTREQYRRLLKSSVLSPAVADLRRNGLLVPLEGRGEDGEEIPVYYFPPSLSEAIRTAILLLPDIPHEVQETVNAELRRVGYFEDEDPQLSQ